MNADPLELAGMLIACGAAAAAILGPGKRWQPAAMVVALVVAPVLVLGDVWNEPRVVDLRESPAQIGLVAVMLVAAIGVGATIARRWRWAFPALVFAAMALRLPVQIGGETSNLLIPLYLVIASGVVAVIWERMRTSPGEPVAVRSRVEPAAALWLRRALAGTLVLYAIQSAYSDDVSNAIENACFFLVPFAVLFCQLAEVRWDRESLLAVGIAVGVVGVGLAVIALAEYAARDLIFNKELLDSNQIKPAFRVNSLFHDPNVLGRYLALGVIGLAAGVSFSRGGRLAKVATVAAVVMLGGLVLSYSITSVAALLAGMGVVAILRYGARGAAAAGVAILLTGAVFALTGGAQRDDVGPVRSFDDETSGRVDLLEGGLELAGDRPIFGWGSGSFGRAFFDHIKETDTTTSHSEPITVAAEQGVPGALLYLALLAAMLWVLFGAGATGSAGRVAAAGGVVALAVHSIGYAGFAIDPATWALLALAVGLRAAPVTRPAS